MSKENGGLWLGALAVLVSVLALIGWVWHERDHEHTDYTFSLVLTAVTLIAITIVIVAIIRNLKDARRASALQAQIVSIRDEHAVQLTGLRTQHARELEAKRLAIEELTAKQLPPAKAAQSGLPYHGDDVGLHFEGAMFGAAGITPIDVSAKVRRCIEKGEKEVPVSWQLLLGHDPKEHFYKYLTVTFSYTAMEGKHLTLPTAIPMGMPPTKQELPEPPALSDAEFAMRQIADSEFRALTFAQRIGLREIYRNPGQFVGKMCQLVANYGFAEPMQTVVDPLMKTSLIHVDGRQTLTPSPHKVVADCVEHLLKVLPL